MKNLFKIFIILLICILTACQSNIKSPKIKNEDKIDSGILNKKDYKIIKKNFLTATSEKSLYIKPTKFNILHVNGIDFIKIEDMYKLLMNIDENIQIYHLHTQKMTDIFDVDNNEININIHREEVIDHRYLIGMDAYEDYTVKSNTSKPYSFNLKVDLTDFKLNYIKYKNNMYFPIMLANYCFFDTSILIYPYKNDEYRIISFKNTSEIYQIKKCINKNEKELSPLLKEVTYNYLVNYLQKFYPYYKLKKEDIEQNIDKMYTNFNELSLAKYYTNMYQILDSLKDYHTSFLHSKYITQLSDYSILQPCKNDYLEKIKQEKLNYNYFLWEEKNAFSSNKYYNLNDTIDYIYFKNFEISNVNDNKFLQYIINDIFKNTEQQKNKSLIIDLRYNPGGYCSVANKILQYLINDYLYLYYTYKTPTYVASNQKIVLKKNDKNQLKYKKIVLLVNEYTYSAANNFVSWFKDAKIGTVIGEKTGGGGSGMTLHALPDGSLINISSPLLIHTNEKGIPIEMGIDPDIYVEDNYGNNTDAIFKKANDYIKN